MLKKIGERVLWQRTKTYVKRYDPIIVGVTGSYGKTLTKEAIALALQDSVSVRAARKSYNTSIGAALSVLGVEAPDKKAGWVRLLSGSAIKEILEDEPSAIVLELGADQPGDIDFLSTQLPFLIGVVTNIGSTHLRLFINKEMVAHEKMSLVVSLPKHGTAILNADDPLVMQMREHISSKCITFGMQNQADVQIHRVHRLGMSGFVVEISMFGKKRYEHAFPFLVGRHQLQSIMVALAVAHSMNVDINQALHNLSRLKPLAGRLRILEGKHQSTIIDDTYNASPESVSVALKTLAAVPAKRRIAILGDMLDLGGAAQRMHKEVGARVAESADVFIAVGEEMREAQAAVLQQRGIDTHHFQSSKDAGKWLDEYVRPGDVVLVKGSRNMHMEEVVRRLLGNPERDESQLVH